MYRVVGGRISEGSLHLKRQANLNLSEEVEKFEYGRAHDEAKAWMIWNE